MPGTLSSRLEPKWAGGPIRRSWDRGELTRRAFFKKECSRQIMKKLFPLHPHSMPPSLLNHGQRQVPHLRRMEMR